MMELHHATSNRVFRRRMTTSTWGAWREIPVVDQATVQGDIIYRGSADFQRLAKGTAGQFLAMNSGATAPEWNSGPIKAWGNINTLASSGTYTRTLTTVTVTLTAHGMTTGQYALLDFTTGTATDGYYLVTVIDANTFTVTDAASGSTSGNVTRNAWVRAGSNIASLTRGTGTLVITFTTPMADANYACTVTAGNLNSLPSAGANVGWIYAYATGSVSIGVSDNNTDSGVNSEAINFVVYR